MFNNERNWLADADYSGIVVCLLFSFIFQWLSGYSLKTDKQHTRGKLEERANKSLHHNKKTKMPSKDIIRYLKDIIQRGLICKLSLKAHASKHIPTKIWTHTKLHWWIKMLFYTVQVKVTTIRLVQATVRQHTNQTDKQIGA